MPLKPRSPFWLRGFGLSDVMHMADVTIAGQLSIMFTIQGRATYEVVESALVDAGFTEYQIARQVYADSTDVTLVLSSPYDPETNTQAPFVAQDTLEALTTAIGQIVAAEIPAPAP